MNIFINTNHDFSEKILNKMINFKDCNLNISIIQLDFNDKNNLLNFINNSNNNISHETKILIDRINEIFKSEDIDKASNLTLFNKLCFLYLNGGIIINNNIVVNKMKTLIELYNENNMFSIKSCVNNNIFSGILSSKPKYNKILNLINTFLDDYKNNSIDELMKDILINENENNYLLTEKIVGEKSYIYFKEETIAEHFFTISCFLQNNKVDIRVPDDLSKIKIGITIHMPSCLKDFYTNGIKQNCLYLYELLKNMNYDVKLIIENNKHVSVLNEIDFYKFEYVTLKDIIKSEFNLIFSMGFSLPAYLFKSLQNINTKLVYYMCGNSYLIDSERILYNQHKNRRICYSENNESFDQIWIIPQMYKQNKYYCETIFRSKSIQIPFIWSPMSIEFVKKILKVDNNSSLLYKKKDSKIGIFEPNISIMKWALPCVLITETTHRTYNNINHVYITNMNKGDLDKTDINQFNMLEFNNMCKCLDLFKEGKLSSETRFITLDLMKQNCDIAISHQWENPLNYLYLELAWMGWPILHNAYLCKDVGYYYEEFNYNEASEKLNDIIINHSSNANEYLKRNRKVIDVYVPSNKELQNKYRHLIENLFKK